MPNLDELFNDSLERIRHTKIEGRDFFDAFYDDFIGRSPTVREKFKQTDMKFQKQMLQQSLFYLVTFVATKTSEAPLERVARVHSRSERDIAPELYDVWMDSIVATLRTHDPNFDDDTELAWRVVLAPGIAFMKFRYDNPASTSDGP